MLRIALTLSLLAAVAAPLTAHAAGLDLITIITDSGGPTYTFTVPTVFTPTPDTADDFTLSGIKTTGPSYLSNDLVYFYDANDSGALEDDSLGLSLEGPAFFSGLITSPTFTLTPLTAEGILSDSGAGSIKGHTYSYSITSLDTTPEPSSVMLLGTGLLGLAGAVRRKLFVNA